MLTLSRIPLDGYNDPRAVACGQLFETCDQLASVHVDGLRRPVDVCAEHAAHIVLAWAEAENERGTAQ